MRRKSLQTLEAASDTQPMTIPVSVLVLTKNEEQDLPGCLESVRWSDDIHVYDSFSNDRTVEIAERAGATVTRRHFDNWASHQNWGLKNTAHQQNLWVDSGSGRAPKA